LNSKKAGHLEFTFSNLLNFLNKNHALPCIIVGNCQQCLNIPKETAIFRKLVTES